MAWPDHMIRQEGPHPCETESASATSHRFSWACVVRTNPCSEQLPLEPSTKNTLQQLGTGCHLGPQLF